jgi:hypothetical protein
MEGSAPGPAKTSLDPNLNSGTDPSPLQDVPIGNAPSTSGAATSEPQPAPQQMHPVESVLMAEMQATKKVVAKAMAANRAMAMALFCIGLACIYYLSGKLKSKLPIAPSDIKPTPHVGAL